MEASHLDAPTPRWSQTERRAGRCRSLSRASLEKEIAWEIAWEIAGQAAWRSHGDGMHAHSPCREASSEWCRHERSNMYTAEIFATREST